MKKTTESGFTMVELLIVMVLLTIMVGMAVPRMDFLFSKNELSSSTSQVTSSMSLARMKSVNDGALYGVQFSADGAFYVVSDPYGTPVMFGSSNQLEEGVTFGEITFIDLLAVFNEYGQLDKLCLPTGDMTGTVNLINEIGDSTRVDVTFITGRIRETNL